MDNSLSIFSARKISLVFRENVFSKLRKKFRAGAHDNEKKRIVISRIKKYIFGLIVDSVDEVAELSEDQIKDTPKLVELQRQHSFLSGIARTEKQVIMLLDMEKMLTNEEEESLASAKR